MIRSVRCIAGVLTLGATAAFAQDAAITDNAKRWTLSAEPSVWFASPGGKMKLSRSGGTSGQNLRTELSDLNLDNPSPSPGGEINLRKGDWGLTVRGFYFSSEGDATQSSAGQIGDLSFASGDRLRSELEFGAVEAEGSYRFIDRNLRPLDEGGHAFNFALDGVAGLRLYDIGWSVREVGAATGESADEFFIEPLVGGKISMELYEQVTVDLQLTAGGIGWSGYDVFSVDVIVGVQWNPHPNLGVQAGYRQLAFGLGRGEDDDRFEQRGALAGLYAGVVLRF